MKTIGDLLSRDLTKKIEEIIQVDQTDEQSVYSEITEYVATDSIRSQYASLLKAVADAPSEPHESVGIWVSGFFGSGKSSFAKNFGYALENRSVLGKNFSSLFKNQITDEHICSLVDLINARFPIEVILFDIAKEQDTRRVTQRIAEFIYTVVLRKLGYSEDFDIAELEIELEAEGKLDQFVAKCKDLHKQEWRIVRKGAQRISRASAVLHYLDPLTYPAADSWAHTQRSRDAAISVSMVVQRTFELFGRRRPGKALVLVIDEVGQHVARSSDKIEDLRATIEEFGKVGKNLLQSRKILAPCWIVVTSQEKLEEVVAAIDSRRVELARLQDRFRHRVDLAPSDIREVATRRVLAKKEEALIDLKDLYIKSQGALNAALRLERTSRRTDVSEEDFIQFYPYPPHYIDISISVMSGIRLQPGAPKHFGGANRTIIKQAYEMLVSNRTNLAERPIGSLVTLDLVYELVEGNLSNERRTDIHEINERFKSDPDRQWILRVAKVICLLEFVRDLPRTELNLAAFLIDNVGAPAQLAKVEVAVKKLYDAQFIRNTEDGWKLQTAQEKNWETEKKALDPKPRDRNEILRRAFQEVFGEPALRTYRHKDLRTFRVGIIVDGAAVGDEGDIRISLQKAEDETVFPNLVNDTRNESRQKSHTHDLYWLFSITPDIDKLVAEVFASKKMVEKYDQLRAQNKITTDEAACLQDEKNTALNNESRLRYKLTETLERGTGMFRGVDREAASLGKNLGEITKKFLGHIVPDLYPKLQMGCHQLKGDEVEQILRAADLKALPIIFYAGADGLGLVEKEGSKYVIKTSAEITKEVLDYLKAEHGYGNKESRTGKALERRFCGIGYGWELDMVRLVLAVLFRSGEIEVAHQGTRFASYKDPASRPLFTKTIVFRSSLFSPRQALGLKMLTQAVQQLENLTGIEVDVEEASIAKTFKKVASEELEILYPLKAIVDANHFPVADILAEYQQTLLGIQSSTSDDCVRIITETGDIFCETRSNVRKLRDVLNEDSLITLSKARTATEEVWHRLSPHSPPAELANCVDGLENLLNSERFYESMDAIAEKTKIIMDAYRIEYLNLHDKRSDVYGKAIDEIKNRPEWEFIVTSRKEIADSLLAPLLSRMGDDSDRQAVENGSTLGQSTLTEMKSDLAAVNGLQSSALIEMQKLSMGDGKKTVIRHVRLKEIFNRPIQTKEDLDAAIELLRDSLQKFIDEGSAIILE